MHPSSITSYSPPSAPERPPVMHVPSPRGLRTAQVFLGMFVLWQLFYLCSANLLSLANKVRKKKGSNDATKTLPRGWQAVLNRIIPGWLDEKGHVHDCLDILDKVNDRWEKFTGQPEHWQLFAPGITRDITFVAVELRWDEDPRSAPAVARPLAPLMVHNLLELANLAVASRGRALPYAPEPLPSKNEPANPKRFFKWGKFRLRKYESYLDLVLEVEKDRETPAEAADRCQGEIKTKVRDEWDKMLPYLRMRCREFLAEHPERPMPKQVILLVRRYEIPKPEEFSTEWYKPDVQTVARWQPGVKWVDGFLPIEANVPKVQGDRIVAGHFEAVAR
jgi:hypothetical protein